MALATEYADDSDRFLAVNPKSIDPDHLVGLALFERQPVGQGRFRYRCLLKDTRSISRERLIRLLSTWDTVYVHHMHRQAYQNYVKENLSYILEHGEIEPRHKADSLVMASTEVIKKSFEDRCTTREEVVDMVTNVKSLVSEVVSFLSDLNSLDGLAKLVGHDYDTLTHSIKVGWLLAVFVSENRDLFSPMDDERFREQIIHATTAGFLHDLGKVKIPKNIINKRGQLSNLEYILIQSHTAYAGSLLFHSGLSTSAMEAIIFHHENEDGSGYPSGLKGDEIPLMAKICHIVDVFDALTSKRPYKSAKTAFEALAVMSGENPFADTLKKFEEEVRVNRRVPVTAKVRDDYEDSLKRLREKEILEEEAKKRVEARLKLRDRGMVHCFDKELLKRFILTINKSGAFDLSAFSSGAKKAG